MKKKLALLFYTVLLGFSSCIALGDLSELGLNFDKISLEHINSARIEKAVKKYEQLMSEARWMRRLKYAAIGTGGGIVLGLLMQALLDEKPKAVSNVDSPSTPASDSEVNAQIVEGIKQRIKIDKARGERKKFSNRLKDNLFGAFLFVVASCVVAGLRNIIDRSGEALSFHFSGLDLQDPEVYKQKNERINNLIKRLGGFLLQHGQNFKGELVDDKIFDLIFADILIDHTTLVRLIEDMIGFIKCAVMLDAGVDELELACLDKDIVVLGKLFDAFTDNITLFVNSDNKDRSLIAKATEMYMVFCKQFSKFICDCGLYLYDQDFLQD